MESCIEVIQSENFPGTTATRLDSKDQNDNLDFEELCSKPVCRTCFSFTATNSFLPLNCAETPVYLQEIVNLCLPKIDLDLIKDPLICQKCFVHLENFYNLINFCMKTEKDLEDYCSSKTVELPIVMSDFVTYTLKNSVKKEENLALDSNETNDVDIKDEETDPVQCRLTFCTRKRTKTVNNLIEAEVKCELCSQKFSSKWDLDGHSCTHRDENSNYSCETCHSKFKYKHSYIKHVNSHYNGNTMIKPFSCECGKSFNRKAKLKKHQEIHIKKERPFGCKNCGKRFTEEKLLDSHIERVHVNEKAFACHICVNKYTSKAGLDVHLKSHLPSYKPRPEPDLMCDICGKLFYRKYSLEKHHMSHTGDKPHECEQCGTRFKERYQLTIHMRRHTGEKPFGCEVCGFKFSCKNRLSVHMRKHTGVRPFPCHLCDMAFTRNDHLTKHIRAIHTGERPFECDICSKSFYRKDYLLKHKHNVHFKCKQENDQSWTSNLTLNV